MPHQNRVDTQDMAGADSEPRSRDAGREEAASELSESAAAGERSDSTDGAVVQADPIQGAVELAHILAARIEAMCRELDEKSERIETLEQSLAARDSQIEEVQRELEESRDLIARLTEASRQDRVAESGTAGPVAAARHAGADALPASAGIPGAEGESRPEPAIDVADLVAAAMAREGAGHAEDQAELDDYLAQLDSCAARVDTLRDRLTPSVTAAATELKECGGAFESLPPELQETLRGRHEGLELIGKMIRRLVARLPAIGEPSERSLPLVGEDEWVVLLDGVKGRDSAEERIRQKLEEMSSKRYRTLGEQRRLVDTSRQSLLQFLKAQVLPVLDGIEDGEKHSRELIARLKTTDKESKESLETWYRAYETLHAELLGLLEQIKVRPLEVRCGAPIDYERHEPFGVEADPDLKTDDVKAVTRAGYEFTLDEREETFVLRPAQVIVVKNAKEPDRA